MSKLADYIEKTLDNRGKNPEQYYSFEKYPVIDNYLIQNNFHPDLKIVTRYIDQNEYDLFIRDYVKKDEVIMTLVGNGIGNVALMPTDEATIIQNTIGFRTKSSLDDIFLYYYFIYIQSNIRALDRGSSQPSIKKADILDLEVNLPDIKSQQQTAGLLSRLDKKIETNNKINATLESIAREIFDHWFMQFNFPDENGKPYKSSGGKMVWNEELKREIPAGWKAAPIGNFFTTNRGVSYNSTTLEGKGIPMVNLASFTPTGAYKNDGIKSYSGDYTEDKVLKPYDLVMCNTQQTAIDFSKDIIGRGLLVPDIFEGDIVSSHHVNTIRTVDEDLKFYLYYLFNSDHFHKYVTGYANGTNILGLVFEGVEKYISEIPEKRVLQEFAKLSLSIEKKKSEIIRENQELISLRDFLLPLLMNGQIGFKEECFKDYKI